MPSHDIDYAVYLSAALDQLNEITGRSDWPIVIFSDDLDLSAANLVHPRIATSPVSSMLDDFLGFMNCEHKITSNSTFAWWAAFLGNNSGVTIAPHRWHEKTDLAQTQILMPDWRAVNY